MNYRIYDQKHERVIAKTAFSPNDKFTGHIDIQRLPSPRSNDQIKDLIAEVEALDRRYVLVFYTVHGEVEPDGNTIIRRWTPGISIDIMMETPSASRPARTTRHSMSAKSPENVAASDRKRAQSSPAPRKGSSDERERRGSRPPMPPLPSSGNTLRVPTPKQEVRSANQVVAPTMSMKFEDIAQLKSEKSSAPVEEEEKGGCCCIIC